MSESLLAIGVWCTWVLHYLLSLFSSLTVAPLTVAPLTVAPLTVSAQSQPCKQQH